MSELAGVFYRDGRVQEGPDIQFDGRLDNRAELTAQLGPGTDPELVFRAYAKWGEQALAHLLGDFAFALRDNRRQLLFCARDPFGVRPFHYHCGPRVVRFSSAVRPLLAAPEVSSRINEGVVAEYLAFSHATRGESLFVDIQRLPAGHALVVAAGQVRQFAWWTPPVGRRIRYRDEREYAAHFRDILQQAIACREGDGCLMSGGLDSTSVALLARVPVYSLIFPGLDCDESSYIDAVVDAGALSSQRLAPAPPDAELLDALVERDGLPPLAPNYTMVEQLCSVAVNDGHRRLLTGQAGDHAMVGSRLYYADLLRRGRWLALRRALRRDFGSDRSRAWGELRTASLYPLLPPPLLRALRRWRRGPHSDELPPWIAPAFAARTQLRDRLAKPEPQLEALPDLLEREYYRLVLSAELAYSMESNHRCAAAAGAELLHPFLDRRLIEFAFHIPPELWLRGDETKLLLRQAMDGILPDRVRLRRDKAEFSPFVLDALNRLPPERWLHHSVMAREGWIDAPQLAAAYRHQSLRLLGPLWEACSIEWWLRAQES